MGSWANSVTMAIRSMIWLKTPLEETAYLLPHGELPTLKQLETFAIGFCAARILPNAVVDIVHRIKHAHLWMSAYRVSSLAALMMKHPTVPRRPFSEGYKVDVSGAHDCRCTPQA